VPDVRVLITHALSNYKALTFAVVVLPGEGLGAPNPLPMRAFDGANAARHAPGHFPGQDVIEIVLGWPACVLRLPLLDNEIGQAPGGLEIRRARQASGLAWSVVGLSMTQTAQRRCQLLDGMGLQAPGIVDGALPQRLVASGLVEPLEDGARHAVALFKMELKVDRRLPANPNSSRKVRCAPMSKPRLRFGRQPRLEPPMGRFSARPRTMRSARRKERPTLAPSTMARSKSPSSCPSYRVMLSMPSRKEDSKKGGTRSEGSRPAVVGATATMVEQAREHRGSGCRVRTAAVGAARRNTRVSCKPSRVIYHRASRSIPPLQSGLLRRSGAVPHLGWFDTAACGRVPVSSAKLGPLSNVKSGPMLGVARTRDRQLQNWGRILSPARLVLLDERASTFRLAS